MTCWDLALPADPIEGTALHEEGDYKVIEIKDRYLCYEGDREVHDYGDEWSAIAWFDNITSECEYDFDRTTLNSGVILDILNNYKGDNIWQDVIYQFDFEDIVTGDWSFTMEDEDGDILEFYYIESSKEWTWRQTDIQEEECTDTI